MSTPTVELSTILQDAMRQFYYEINPPRHAEKAYQPNQGDRFPTLSTVPTTTGDSRAVVVLLTTVRNVTPFDRAELQIIDYDGLLRYSGGTFPTPEVAQKIIANYPQVVVAHCAGLTPCGKIVSNVSPRRVTVRVLTGGYMGKLLSYEDFDAGTGGRGATAFG